MSFPLQIGKLSNLRKIWQLVLANQMSENTMGDANYPIRAKSLWQKKKFRWLTAVRRRTLLPSRCCDIMHQSIPPTPRPPPPPGADPHYQFFFALHGKFPGLGTLELSNPRSGGWKKRANAPSSVDTATFSLIAQSNSAILSILMCDFLFQLTSSFVIALGF